MGLSWTKIIYNASPTTLAGVREIIGTINIPMVYLLNLITLDKFTRVSILPRKYISRRPNMLAIHSKNRHIIPARETQTQTQTQTHTLTLSDGTRTQIHTQPDDTQGPSHTHTLLDDKHTEKPPDLKQGEIQAELDDKQAQAHTLLSPDFSLEEIQAEYTHTPPDHTQAEPPPEFTLDKIDDFLDEQQAQALLDDTQVHTPTLPDYTQEAVAQPVAQPDDTQTQIRTPPDDTQGPSHAHTHLDDRHIDSVPVFTQEELHIYTPPEYKRDEIEAFLDDKQAETWLDDTQVQTDLSREEIQAEYTHTPPEFKLDEMQAFSGEKQTQALLDDTQIQALALPDYTEGPEAQPDAQIDDTRTKVQKHTQKYALLDTEDTKQPVVKRGRYTGGYANDVVGEPTHAQSEEYNRALLPVPEELPQEIFDT